MKNVILVLNAGSSSIKFSLFSCQLDKNSNSKISLIYHGSITGINTQPRFQVTDTQHNILASQTLDCTNHQQSLAVLFDWLEHHETGLNLVAAGHRVVHGGTLFTTPVRITDSILIELERLIPLAPLHQPHNLAGIKALCTLKPNLPQVACFDTAFHCTQPLVAQQFALPQPFFAQGIKRYGFHGLSYEYISTILPDLLSNMPQRVIVAHLGNGVSLCALKQGKSIATTMGFTPLEGVPMGTRCGAVDPGVLLHLLTNGMSVEALTDLLYYRSGLLGMSGLSNDMQTLLHSDSPQAKATVDFFIYRLHRELGSLVAALGGLDALVFTAGIGQNAAVIRARLCNEASWLGINLDEAANECHATRISRIDSRVSVWVIPTDEEKMIAQHVLMVLLEKKNLSGLSI